MVESNGATHVDATEESGADGPESRIRWWFVGRFSPDSTGLHKVVTPEQVAGPFKDAPLVLEARIADQLGMPGEVTYPIPFGRLSDLTVSEVVRGSRVLSELHAWVEQRAMTTDDPAAAAEEVARIAGPGALAVSVRAIAGAGPSQTTRKQMRAAVESAIFASARAALSTKAVAGLETAWRGMRLVADRAGSEIELRILDLDAASRTGPAKIEAALGRLASFDRPDAVFVVEPVKSVEAIAELAGIGADYNVPFVVEGTPELMGAESWADVSTLSHQFRPAPDFMDLRTQAVARFVCVAVNRVVGKVDGAGSGARIALVSPAFGVAAMLSQSFLATGGPGRIFGAAGALVAGGTQEIPGRGGGDALAIAVESFFSIDVQTRLAAHGVLGLGGPRNSDRVQLAVAPMLSSEPEAGGLPAQLLTARAIRFAQWARDQIPIGTPDLEVIAIFEQAATALLFPNRDVAQMNATVTSVEGNRTVVLRTRARGEWLGVPMDATFALPLR